MTAFLVRFGTRFSIKIDISEFSLKTGWNNVYDFGKRVTALAAFICVASAMFPIWMPSQTAMQYQLNENTRKLETLANVPADIAVIKEKLAAMDGRQTETRNAIESLRETGQWIILALLGWMGKEIFQFLGGKFGRNGKDAT